MVDIACCGVVKCVSIIDYDFPSRHTLDLPSKVVPKTQFPSLLDLNPST